MPKLSIIIPTLNEEKYLPILLESIKKQSFKDYEVIVADNFSKDKTREIAKKYNAIVVDGGLPAKARNNAAKIAKAKVLLFLDADVSFDKEFIKNFYEDFVKKNKSCATAWAFSWDNKKKLKSIMPFILMNFANMSIFLMQKIRPMANGFCIMVKKDIHKKIKGFNENLEFGEDSDYVKRAAKYNGFYMFTKKAIISSPRRFIKKGFIKMLLKYIRLNSKSLFGKKVKEKYFD